MRPPTCEYVIPVPGRFMTRTAYLDLETVKVPAPAGFRMENGERLRQRWSVTMYGIALNGKIFLSENQTETENLIGLSDHLSAASEAVYAATREFDEMILKGRFTNARRAHERRPFFPYPSVADEICWRNIAPLPVEISRYRSPDIPSKDVPDALDRGDWLPVAVHLLRDVVSLILAETRVGNSIGCRDWCVKVLQDYSFAQNEIVGEEK